jgi:putative transposase
MYRTQSNVIRGLEKQEYEILREMCGWAKNMYNFALYNVRQHYFATKEYFPYKLNYHVCKVNENYKLLNSNIAQQTVIAVENDYKKYFALFKKKQQAAYPFFAKQSTGKLPLL